MSVLVKLLRKVTMKDICENLCPHMQHRLITSCSKKKSHFSQKNSESRLVTSQRAARRMVGSVVGAAVGAEEAAGVEAAMSPNLLKTSTRQWPSKCPSYILKPITILTCTSS
jgi:hypothetical protein